MTKLSNKHYLLISESTILHSKHVGMF